MNTPLRGSSDRLRWETLPEWETLLFGPEGLRLEEWKGQGRAEVVKHGPHQTVYLVRLPQAAVYVKHRRPNRPADVARHLVRASVARREWHKAAELARRGVPTVRPLAWQEGTRFGLVWDSFLVTEAIDPACSLEEYVSRLPQMPAGDQRAARRRVIRGLARFTAAIHRAGVVHRDFHAGNILLGPDPCSAGGSTGASWPMHLIDVPGVRFTKGGPLGWAASRQGLVMLNAGWWERTSRSERLRFWITYLGERPDLVIPDRRAAIEGLELDTWRYARKIACRRDRRAMWINRDFAALAGPASRLHAVADLDEAELARMLNDPEDLLWENLARPVKLGHTTLAVRGELDCGGRRVAVLYKRYRPRNWWKAFLARFRHSRAVRSWRGGHSLLLRGIATARPVAVCEVRGGKLPRCGYLATEWIEGAENLHLYGWRLAALPSAERFRKAACLAERLGALVGRMHAWGVAHGDLKGSNLLVADAELGPVAYLIDADDVTVCRRLGRRQHRDLARLATSIQAHPWISGTLVARFIRAYRRQFPAGRLDWRQLWRTAARRSLRQSRRKRQRGEPVL
jgi:tRNA A-37 threonylcarbamoyl transferase component Bud32